MTRVSSLSASALICSFWSEHDLARPSPKSAQLPFGASIRTPLPKICSGKKYIYIYILKRRANMRTPKVNLKVDKIGNELHYCLFACDLITFFFSRRSAAHTVQVQSFDFGVCGEPPFASPRTLAGGVLFTYIANTSHAHYSCITFTSIKHLWRHVTHRQSRMRMLLRLEIPPSVLWMRTGCEVQMKVLPCAACAFRL